MPVGSGILRLAHLAQLVEPLRGAVERLGGLVDGFRRLVGSVGRLLRGNHRLVRRFLGTGRRGLRVRGSRFRHLGLLLTAGPASGPRNQQHAYCEPCRHLYLTKHSCPNFALRPPPIPP